MTVAAMNMGSTRIPFRGRATEMIQSMACTAAFNIPDAFISLSCQVPALDHNVGMMHVGLGTLMLLMNGRLPFMRAAGAGELVKGAGYLTAAVHPVAGAALAVAGCIAQSVGVGTTFARWKEQDGRISTKGNWGPALSLVGATILAAGLMVAPLQSRVDTLSQPPPVVSVMPEAPPPAMQALQAGIAALKADKEASSAALQTAFQSSLGGLTAQNQSAVESMISAYDAANATQTGHHLTPAERQALTADALGQLTAAH